MEIPNHVAVTYVKATLIFLQLPQIKRMTQSSVRNSILGIYGGFNLAQAATN